MMSQHKMIHFPTSSVVVVVVPGNERKSQSVKSIWKNRFSDVEEERGVEREESRGGSVVNQ